MFSFNECRSWTIRCSAFVYLAQLKPAISRDWSSSLWRRIIQREGKVETWHSFADIGAEVKQSREAEGNSSQSSDCSRPGQRGPMVDLQDAKSAKCKVIAALCTQAAVFLAWYQSWRRCGFSMLFTAFVFLIVINLQPKFVCLVSGEAQWAATPGLAGSSHLGRFRCPASGWRWVPRNLVTENCADEEDVKIFISSMQIWIAMFSNSSCPLESMASLRRRRWCVGGCCKTGQSFARSFANQSSHLSKEGPGEATIVTIVKLHTRAKAFELKYTVLVKLFKKSIPTAPTWTPQMLLDSVFPDLAALFYLISSSWKP